MESDYHQGGHDEPPVKPSLIRAYFKSLELAIVYDYRSLRRSKRVFYVGISAVALVVFFITFLQNIIQQSPIIFFRLSEVASGEIDLLLTPNPSVNNASIFVNGTFVAERINRNIREVRAEAIVQDGGVRVVRYPALEPNITNTDPNLDEFLEKVNGSSSRWIILGKMRSLDFPILNASTRVVLMDTELEEELAMGRGWPFRTLGEAEAHVDAALLRAIGVRGDKGERVILNVDFLGVLGNLLSASTSELNRILGNTVFQALGITPESVRDQLQTVQTTIVPALESLVNATVPGDQNITIPVALIEALETLLNGTGGGVIPGLGGGGNVTITSETLQVLQDQLRAALEQQEALFGALGLNATGPITTEAVIDGVVNLVRQALIFELELSVVSSLGGSAVGRWPSSVGSVSLVDSRYLLKLVRKNLRETLSQVSSAQGAAFSAFTAATGVNETTVDNLLASLRLNDYGLLNVVQYKDRLQGYVKTGADLKEDMVRFSDAAMEALGQDFTPNPSLPVYLAIQSTQLVRLFLDQLFLLVVVVLCFLGCLLIYQLIINDIDEKTYEYGMLRALGMRKRALIQLITVQSTFFSVPGICTGVFAAWLVSLYPTYFIADYGKVQPSYALRGLAVLVGFLVGSLMPLVSNIAPIRRALGRTLRDSLDVYHQASSDLRVTFVRLAELGLDPGQITIALILIVTGFTVYYLFPYAIVFGNFALLLTLLLAILLGMVLGFVLLSRALQPTVERLLLHAIVLPPHRMLLTLILQNMTAHRPRNSKAALMFTTSMSFLIFAGTMFSLQAVTIPMNLRILLGSDVIVSSSSYTLPLDEDGMRGWLDTEMARGPGASRVRGFAFRSFDLRDWPGCSRFEIGTLAGWPDYDVPVYGIDETFLDATYADTFIATERESGISYASASTASGVPDVPRSLYTSPGKGAASFGALSRQRASLGADPRDLVVVTGADAARKIREIRATTPAPPPTPGDGEDPTGSSGSSSAPVFELKPIVAGAAYDTVIPVIVTEAMRYPAGVDTTVPLVMRIRYELEDLTTGEKISYGREILSRARAMVRKVPGDFFTEYRFGASISPVFISQDAFYSLMTAPFNATQKQPEISRIKSQRDFPSKPPKSKLFVRLKEGVNREEREAVINALKGYISDDITSTTDTISIIESTKTASDMILLFFLIVGILTLILSFFVLISAFYSNVNDMKWTFGVLRAIGISVFQLEFSYVYESFSLVLSSLLLSTVIGLILAIALTLQFNVFIESPFAFQFPTGIYLSMVFCSVFSAFFGSWLPVRSLQKQEIAAVIRGN